MILTSNLSNKYTDASMDRFSFSRLMMLLRMGWRLNAKKYLLTFVVFLIAILGFSLNETSITPIVFGMVSVGYFVLFFIGVVYNKTHGVSDIGFYGLPAKTSEKWWYMIITGVILTMVSWGLIELSSLLTTMKNVNDGYQLLIKHLNLDHRAWIVIAMFSLFSFSISYYLFIRVRNVAWLVILMVFLPNIASNIFFGYILLMNRMGAEITALNTVYIPASVTFVVSVALLIASYYALKKIQFRS